jgi:hypothetical protein
MSLPATAARAKATAVTDAEKRRRADEEAMLLGLFAILSRDTVHRLREIVTAYLNSMSTFWTLSDSLVAALSDSHAHASYLGRRLAGSRTPYGHADQLFAASVMAEQSVFLQGLLQDLQAGKYADGVTGALAARLAMYARALRKTANESWALNLHEGTLINWVLSDVPEKHCGRCPELAAGSPYPSHALPTYPASGELPCKVNCLCHLETVDGAGAFLPVEL